MSPPCGSRAGRSTGITGSAFGIRWNGDKPPVQGTAARRAGFETFSAKDAIAPFGSGRTARVQMQ